MYQRQSKYTFYEIKLNYNKVLVLLFILLVKLKH